MESYKKRDRSRSPGAAERTDAEPVKIKKRLVKVKRLRTRERSLEDQDRARGSGSSTVGSPSAGPSKRPEREYESRESRRSRAEPSTRSRIPSPAPRVVGYSSDEQKEEELGPVLGPEREPRPSSPPREISSPRRQIPFVSGPSTPPPPRPNPLLGDCRSVFNYTRLNHIADGAYGTVYRAKCNDTGGIYALKKLKLEPQEEAQGYPTISLAEVSAVMVVRDHENIVDVREIVVGDKLTQVFIVMPFIEHDLKTLVETMPHPFSQSEVKTLMRQLLSAVGYCHDRMILHRDLKTSNLLLTNRGQLKVADFGLARKYTEPPGEMTQLVVTLWYRSPELLLGTKVYSTAIDVWSIGCIFAELMQKEPLFPGRGEIDQIKRIFDLLGKPTEQMWPGFSRLPITRRINPVGPPYSSLRKKYQYLTSAGYDLLAGLLRYDPKQRISAAEGLEHPYFEESPYPKHPDMFPSFPSTAAGEKRHKIQSPPAPARAKSKAESKPYQMVFDFSS